MVNKDNGIKFCPACGNSTENELMNLPLPNGADWVCSKCDKYVEAYVLEENN